MIDHKVDLLQIGFQVLQPQGGALANGDRLRRLIVGITQRGQILILLREAAQTLHRAQQFTAQVFQAVPVDDQVGVIGHIAARGAQVNNARSGRGSLAVGIDVRHYVVADFLFPGLHAVIVDIRDMRSQLVHLRLRHRQAQFHFRFCQRHPQPPPGLIPGVSREQLQHILTRIP